MKNQGKGLPYAGSCLYSKELRLPLWLRYCPLCVIDDRSFFGECYWHRIHQLKGLMCCPTHLVYLENSNIRARNRDYLTELVSAEQAVFTVNPRPINLKEYCEQTLLKMACDSVWLLNQPSLAPGLESIYNCFLTIMAEHGYANYRGQVPVNCLLKLILDKYPPALLEITQCGFNAQNANNWLSRALRDLINNRPQHPIRYLLLMYLFDYTAKTFFERCLRDEFTKPSANFRPFGKGPWPCLNQVNNHFQQLKIKECRITYTKKTRIIKGEFHCICGFTYTRHGPDTTLEAQYSYIRVTNFGATWGGYLKKLWGDSSLSTYDIANQLGASHHSVIGQAIRLKLLYPRFSLHSGPDHIYNKLKKHIDRSTASKSKLLNYKRNEWLLALRENPTATRINLQKEILPNTYAWLYRYDREWLKSHMPAPLYGKIQRGSQTNWTERDIRLSERVHQVASELKKAHSPFLKVTKKAITRRIGDDGSLLNHHSFEKLPITSRILAGVLETNVEYAIRRLNWIAAHLHQEGLAPSRSALIHRAQINWNICQIPEVKNTLDTLSWHQPNITTIEAA
jgi:hypothetical protein